MSNAVYAGTFDPVASGGPPVVRQATFAATLRERLFTHQPEAAP